MSLRKLVAAVVVASLVGALLATDVGAGQKKVLIFGLTKGFRHKDAIEEGSPIMKRLAEGLGYEAVVSEDPAMFDPDKVGQWDLIIYNNCTGRLIPEKEERRKALMDRIKGGAGFMGFHAATDCNYNWPEYGEMINGYFSGHPWNQEVHSKIEDPEHPLMKPFGGKPFVVKDEIYQFRDYKRSAVRILMSIDNRSVPVARGARKDRDYAICWIRPWEKGRVYYNAHGHYGHVFEDKTFQEHVKLAMQWAIGDTDVDTTPSKEIDKAALAANAMKTLTAADATDEQLVQALDVLSWCPRPEALPKALELLGRNQQVAAVAADAVQAIVAVSEDMARGQKIDVLKKALPCATSRTVRKAIRGQLKGLGVTDLPINVPPGFIAHWWVAGPLPSPNHAMFDKAYPPEEGVDLAQGFEAEGKKLAWKKVETDDDGIVNLNEELRRASNVGAYMYAEVTLEREADAELRLGSDDGFVLWLNGQRLGGKKVNRGLSPGTDKFRAKLKAGANQVLMKVLQGGGDWAGCLQIVGPKGGKVDFQVRTK